MHTMDSNTTLVEHGNFFSPSYVVLPAIMALICFICTVMSITVASFICFRDREAKDENEIIMKKQRADEFISNAISLFYNIRTFHIFRIKDVIADKNETKPVIIGNKADVIKMLQLHGISLTEKEDRELSSLSEIFEIDADALLYLELERFSKSLALHGEETLRIFSTVNQDGVAFQSLFFPEKKPVYEKELIYTIYREMRKVTDLFILLLTGIDAGFISRNDLPKQFQMCYMKEELTSLEDFFYNYYKRLYSRQFTRPAFEDVQSWQPTQWSLPRTTSEATEPEIPKQPTTSVTGPVRVSKFRKAYHSLQAAQRLAVKKIRPSSPKYTTSTDIEEDEETKIDDQNQTSLKQSNSDPDLRSPSPTNSVPKNIQPTFTRRRSSHLQQVQQPRLIRNPWSTRKRGRLTKQTALENDAFTFMVFKVLESLKGNAIEEKDFKNKTYNEVDRNFIL